MIRRAVKRRGGVGSAGERGFTLLEVMFGMVLMTVGLLAVADVFPRGLALSLYGKDQTKAASLAQQQIEFLRTQATTGGVCPSTPISQTATAALSCLVGDYGAGVVGSAYFDLNGGSATQSAAYFTRDVQVQYWTWSASTSQFVIAAGPYTAPSSGTQYVFRISVATHWLARGQTAYASSGGTKGCVVGGSALPTGIGCVQVSTFISP